MKKFFFAALMAGCLCSISCAPKLVVNKNWEAAGGSRADATVELGFVYNPQTEQPNLNESQANAEALKRCQAWGYADVEPFGMAKQECQQKQQVYGGGVICTSMLVTRKFQCLGQGNSAYKEMSSKSIDMIESTNKAFFKAGKTK